MNIHSKLPKVGTTIFSVMSKMAIENNALNLSQGFPDFPIDPQLIELTHKAMIEGYNQYAPMPGHPLLRISIAEKINSLYQQEYCSDSEITITSGATEALFCAIQTVVSKDDEVIIFEPAYDCYEPAIELAGGKTIAVQLKAPEFKIDWEEVENLVNSKTKAIIINTPHNPTGSILEASDIEKLKNIVLKNELILISDEVYEHLIFDKEEHQSILKHKDLMDNSIVTFSFGKVLHATGWKLGYAVAGKTLTKEFRKVHQFVTFSSPTPMQIAISEYLKTKENYTSLPHFFEQKRNLFQNELKNSRFELIPCRGTYFQGLSYKNISEKSDMEMAEFLTKKHGIASIPLSAFYQNGTDEKVLRFCFAKQDETLIKAAKILCQI